jgi:hypothetical protein
MFISWALLLIYPAFRPASKAWREQLQLAALVYIALPLVNALTTDKHLVNSLSQQDWGFAAFDLTFFTVGCCFAFSAYKYKTLQPKKVVSRKKRRQDNTLDNDNRLQLPRISKENG